MITPRQIRAARSLLDWSQQELADRAIVSLNAVTRLERSEVDPRVSTVAALEHAFRKAGIEFLPEGPNQGEGVRLMKPGSGIANASRKARKRKAPLSRRT
jgi:transcriptional regulator with XRE-family HTH domain